MRWDSFFKSLSLHLSNIFFDNFSPGESLTVLFVSQKSNTISSALYFKLSDNGDSSYDKSFDYIFYCNIGKAIYADAGVY